VDTPLRVFSDFDGSLSEITSRPQDAVPIAGAVSVIEKLSQICSVAIVSGRRVAFLAQHFAQPSVDLYGLYGIEARLSGSYEMRVDEPEMWIALVAEAGATLSGKAPPGVAVEVKGLSLTIHFRAAPEASEWVATNARETAAQFGLDRRPARMSIELHPTIALDKGTVVVAASPGEGRSIYIGDDLGDLPAYDGLDRLAEQGHEVLRVAVKSPESPPELLSRADITVAGPGGAVRFLEDLLSSGYQPR
jgi:trehalose 6-phosphate phosphatase